MHAHNVYYHPQHIKLDITLQR